VNRLQLETTIRAPLEVTYRLALTIPVQERALTRVHARALPPVSPDPLEPGDTVAWKARWLGVPWRMRTRITSADPPRGFVDDQISGPFGGWHHEHHFTSKGDCTVMRDDVSWSAPYGGMGQLVVAIGFGRFVTTLLQDHNRLLAQLIEKQAGAAQR